MEADPLFEGLVTMVLLVPMAMVLLIFASTLLLAAVLLAMLLALVATPLAMLLPLTIATLRLTATLLPLAAPDAPDPGAPDRVSVELLWKIEPLELVPVWPFSPASSSAKSEE
ncbi:hypothetical protein B0A49_02283 [Cryomyces minteri]|uniref:Uncharacterized protein n=1 Tax=Cryomyces minteri TaxID=331657 RepID=A0A4U0XRT0_9PEZI|nr:hypothetical protein B0A49_02283 [Cryomyces minteri]